MAQLYLVDGIEFSRYHHAVSHVLVAYSITGAIAMGTVAKYLGSEPSATWQLVLLMGGIEVVLSQLPSLEEIWWVSALGTLSSLGYVFIALGLGLAYCGAGQGSLGGRPGSSDANKAFGVMNSLGNIAFAFGFAQVLMEIQDTLRQPPKAEKTMRKAVSVASIGSFVLYLSSAVACYAALGNGVPGEVLEGFEDAPDWLLIVANLLICVHMITAWQVWAQPVFDTIESHLKARRIRKQSAAAGLPPAGGGIFADAEPSASAGGSMAKEHQEHQPSPFDVAAPKAEASGAGAHPPQPYVHWEPPLVVVAEASQSGEDMAAPSIDLEAHGSQALALALSYKGKLRSGQLSARGSGASLVFNTNPLPDLLPPGGWTSSRRLAHADLERRSSRLSSVGSRLGSQAMYHLDTGAANEHVPANDAGYLLPFWQRFLVRTSYVLVCTLVACVMVYKPSGRVVAAMKGVGGVMLLVCLAAAVGSVVNVIDSLIHAVQEAIFMQCDQQTRAGVLPRVCRSLHALLSGPNACLWRDICWETDLCQPGQAERAAAFLSWLASRGGSTCTLQLDMWSSGAVPLPVPPGLALAAQLESTLGACLSRCEFLRLRWAGQEFVVGDWVAGAQALTCLALSANELTVRSSLTHATALAHLELSTLSDSGPHLHPGCLPASITRLCSVPAPGEIVNVAVLPAGAVQVTAALPAQLLGLPRLAYLDVSESWFDAAHMAAALPCLTRLTSLALDKCELPDGLPSELTLLTRLRVLSFDGISVSVDGVPVPVAAWSAMLSSLTRLVSLSLSNIHLPELPPAVEHLPRLQNLYLEHNALRCLPPGPFWKQLRVLSTDWEPLLQSHRLLLEAPHLHKLALGDMSVSTNFADGLPPISAVNPLLDTLRSHPSLTQVILVVRPSQLHGAFSPVLDAILQLRTLRPTLHAQSVEHDAFFVEDSVEVLGPGEGEGRRPRTRHFYK
ncbi:Amino acid permease 2 [Micractinium conductrix]|uniref:Amino acid permease 2 n=1 Tax=Micractinium conductrix TaxID=554055 RepID=A0A2P6UZX7_9CHLO|nr:Amino acid permease 2 [Micractinium conductrix]|eukprot:PSC67392.1 Amino acid permease 2 [Micractinium conductrix]